MIGRSRRRSGWGVALLVLMAAAIGGGGQVSAAAAGSRGAVYAPSFTRLGVARTVMASGDYALMIPLRIGPATLIDQRVGRRRTVSFGGDACSAQWLTSVSILWMCNALTGDTVSVQDLATGHFSASVRASVLGSPVVVGVHWLQYDFQALGGPYEPTVRDFWNPVTGRFVSDRSRIGSRLYPDLDAPSLYRTACRRVTLPSSYDVASNTNVPGTLMFFGSVAVGANQNGVGLLRVQRCGSSAIWRVNTTSVPSFAAHNGRAFVWATSNDDGPGTTGTGGRPGIGGIVPTTRQRFTIAMPAQVAKHFDGQLAINDRTLYVHTDIGGLLGTEYQAALPPALASVTNAG